MSQRRRTPSKPVAVIAARIADTGTDVASVAEAAGITADTLQAYLNGAIDMPVVEMVTVGGLLSLTPIEMLAAA